ncbi:MAG TPA: TIR domain-containing protein [Steroidobacteraceae bacterium]|nr:TIR domain-containing protein [Steroidobacteraceae bacterium]
MFVSYASPDAAVAGALVESLERHGIACWIAPRDVKAGAIYADAIVRAISGAKALVLVLSKDAIGSSHVGKEIERASSKKRPIITLRIDNAPLTPALEYFLSESQWIEARAEKKAPAYTSLIDAIRDPERAAPGINPAASPPAGAAPAGHPKGLRNRILLATVLTVVAAALAYIIADKLWLSKRTTVAVTERTQSSSDTAGGSPARPRSTAAEFTPPPHSIAVLPFVNMSGDPKQDYFSDGLSEELLNSLVAVRDLQVAARTSSFTFKGRNDDVADIAHKLNVGAVLEGSVRKDGNQVRITAQLINASTGFHLWSQTYDRDLKNVLTLQTEIATAVTKALQATLLADAAATIEIGGTQNPAAFDAYLRGKNRDRMNASKENVVARMAAFAEAIRLDPKFAKAHVGAAAAQIEYAGNYAPGPDVPTWNQRARENAETAIALAPQLGEAHVVMGLAWERGYLNFARAESEYERALALAPNDTGVLMRSGRFSVTMGRTESGLANIRRAIAMDQLNPQGYTQLSFALHEAKKDREAVVAVNRALQIDADSSDLKNARGLYLLSLGEIDAARESCETSKRGWQGMLCLAILYDQLHRHAEAESERAAMQAVFGDGSSYQMAEIYAQWGDTSKALEWLETAYRLPDPGIVTLRVDAMIDPLRKETRFREIERELNFPNW